MRISIVTPTLNAERYIIDNLRSVHELQGACLDIEQVVVDGGSIDSTVAAVNSFKKAHSSTITLLQEKDRSMYDAINRGLRIISGDIWACLNADDQYEPQALPRVARKFANDPGLEATYGYLERVNSDGKHLFTYYSPEINLSHFVRRGLCVGMTQPATFLRKSVISKVGPFSTEYHYAADYEYLIRVLRLCKVSRIPIVTTKFREHADSYSTMLSGKRGQVSESRAISAISMKNYNILPHSTAFQDGKNFVSQVRPGNLTYLFHRAAHYLKETVIPYR
jgi:glycosyltransferase involved in cell wall biosynthesis